MTNYICPICSLHKSEVDYVNSFLKTRQEMIDTFNNADDHMSGLCTGLIIEFMDLLIMDREDKKND